MSDFSNHELALIRQYVLKNRSVMWSNLVELIILSGVREISSLLQVRTSDATEWMQTGIMVLNKYSSVMLVTTVPLTADVREVVSRQLRLANAAKCEYLFSTRLTHSNRTRGQDKALSRQSSWVVMRDAIDALPPRVDRSTFKLIKQGARSGAEFKKQISRIVDMFGDKLSPDTVRLIQQDIKRATS